MAVSMKHSRSGAIRRALSASLPPLTAAPGPIPLLAPASITVSRVNLGCLVCSYFSSFSCDGLVPAGGGGTSAAARRDVAEERHMTLASVCSGMRR